MTSALTNQRRVFKACLTQTEQVLMTSHVRMALWTLKPRNTVVPKRLRLGRPRSYLDLARCAPQCYGGLTWPGCTLPLNDDADDTHVDMMS